MERTKFNKFLKGIALGAAALLAPIAANALDIDGDGKADGAVFRPAFSQSDISSIWAVTTSSGDYSTTNQYQWGLSGDTPVVGNFTSTSGDDLTVYRDDFGIWYIRAYDADRTFSSALAYQWGLSGDRAIGNCDVNADNLDDLIVWRPSNGTWYTRLSASDSSTFSTAETFQWGLSTDTPIAIDYDVDSKCDYAVFRDGVWYISLSSENRGEAGVINWGTTNDTPVPGQWTSDSVPDLAVYRSGRWIIRQSNLAGLKTTVYSWGLSGDLAVPADYDGDGKTDLAVFRPSNLNWYIRTSSSDYASVVQIQFGVNSTDIPLGERRGKEAS